MSSLGINSIYLFLFFFGTIIGSFLNVVILRSEKDQEMIKAPSHCDHCGAKLKV
jgi:leader peptidase (prepilin peptidase)/N-methyltransferase